MNALRVVLVIFGIYALLHITTQSLRHIFVVVIEPRASVLTKLESAKTVILTSDNLDKLVQQYQASKEEVDKWKKGKTVVEINQATYSEEEPHYSARLNREAIERWETRERKLRELHFYWWCGVGLLVAGIVSWRRINPWLGTALLVIAFGEMIYWTTPEFRFWSDNDEFIRLVIWKLIYSVAALMLLLGTWIKLLIPLLTSEMLPSK